MTDFLTQQIPPPENWQDFECLCADLWAKIWNDPNTVKHGRSGQSQLGVDIYGRKDGQGGYLAVQCKGKDGRYKNKVTKKELNDEVELAKTFEPPLEHFILATSAQDDVEIQKEARLITEKHEKEGLFSVQVCGWGEIHRRIADHEDVITKHYPNLGSVRQELEKLIRAVNELQPERTDTAIEIVSASNAVASDTQARVLFEEEVAKSAVTDVIGGQIDELLPLIQTDPIEAQKLFEGLRTRHWDQASDLIRFRLLSNIGASLLQQGKSHEASGYFIDAYEFAKEEEKAICNLCFAKILRDEIEEARQIAEQALQEFPFSAKASSLLLAATDNATDFEAVRPLLKESVFDSAEVQYAFGSFQWRRGLKEEAIEALTKAWQQDQQSVEIGSYLASCMLELELDNKLLRFEHIVSDSAKKSIESAVSVFQHCLDLAKDFRGNQHRDQLTSNLAVALRVLGRSDEALSHIEQTLPVSTENSVLIEQKAWCLFELEDWDGFRSWVESNSLQEREQFSLPHLYAIANQRNFEEAVEHFDNNLSNTLYGPDFYTGLAVKMKALHGLGDTQQLLNVLQEINEDQLATIEALSQAARMAHALNEQDLCTTFLTRAQEKLEQDPELLDTLIVAKLAVDIEEYHVAASLLPDICDPNTDSETLRNAALALYHIDNRARLIQFLDELDPAIRESSFFLKIEAGLRVRTGEVETACSLLGRYLESSPDDLQAIITWLQLLLRMGREEEQRIWLDSCGDYPSAPAIDRMNLAQLMILVGLEQKGLDLAYDVARNNQANADVLLRYIGMIFLGRLDSYLGAPEEVSHDTEITIRSVDGNTKTYFITPDEDDVELPGEISPSHPVAQAALGKRVGDSIEVMRNPLQTEQWEIASIGNRFIHLHFAILKSFEDRFPVDQRLFSVHLDTSKGEKGVEPILRSVDNKHEYSQKVLEMYRTQPLPVSFVSTLIGASALQLWRGLLADDEVSIFCCDGNAPERAHAYRIYEQEAGRGLIDPLTYYLAYSLGVMQPILDSVGSVGITQSGIDLFFEAAEEIERGIGQGSHQFGKKDGQYTLITFTDEELEKEAQHYREVGEWARDHFEVVPAIGPDEMDFETKGLLNHLEKPFSDLLLAASSSGRIIISDDQRLRAIANQYLQVDGVWLQIAMLKSFNSKLLDPSAYSHAVRDLSNCRVHYTTFNHDDLLRLLEEEDFKVSPTTERLISVLGAPNSDIISSIKVALALIRKLSEKEVHSMTSFRIHNLIFKALTRDFCHEQANEIVTALCRLAEHGLIHDQRLFFGSMRGWLKGHFASIQLCEALG